MARMHSRKKGKSGSKKPLKKVKKVWLRYSDKEVEQLIIKLAKQGNTQSKIGIMLRDTYGVPDVKIILNKKVGDVLEEHKLKPKLPEDLVALIKKELNVMKHFEVNKKDMPAKRGLQLTESKINRLVKYYKRKGILDKSWVYDREKAKLLVS
ncbi:30S ribosomal protein S15 [Candidatus Woesearchaeota archaeon]|nr:30S ribosomal protein S15 [Candidatus Woesearchaeota archaeon]